MSEFTIKNKRHLNTLELSDIFRRKARKFDDEAAARKLTKLTRNVACLITHYRPEEGSNHPTNEEVDTKITKEITALAATAKDLNVKKVILPIKKHRKDWCARRLVSHVLSKLDLPIKVELYEGLYSKNNRNAFGQVDGRRRTVLDKDLRGIVTPAIDPVLIAKWKL